MQSRYSKLIQFIHLVGDLVLLNAWILIAAWIRFDEGISHELQQPYYKQLFITLNLLWLVLSFTFGTYNITRTARWVRILRKVYSVFFFHFLCISAFMVLLKAYNFSRLFLTYFYFGYFFSVVIWRIVVIQSLRYYRSKGFNYRKIILIGDGSALSRFYSEVIPNNEFGYKYAGYFSDNPVPGIDRTGSYADFKAYAKKNQVDEIYCSFEREDDRVLEVSQYADNNLMRFRYIPNLSVFGARRFNIEFIETTPVLIERKEPLELIHNRIVKEVFDYLFALIVTLFVFPWLLPIIAIAIRLDSKGPVFFIQQRSGRKNTVIKCIKFRTMHVDPEKRKKQASKHDARITRVGHFLRRTSLDEIPQFLNVLTGSMSVVGPRPHMLAHTREYRRMTDQFMVRHFIKPGITGLAQVNGYRGEIRTDQDMKKRVYYDVNYLENWSLILDIKIVVKTVIGLLKGQENAY